MHFAKVKPQKITFEFTFGFFPDRVVGTVQTVRASAEARRETSARRGPSSDLHHY